MHMALFKMLFIISLFFQLIFPLIIASIATSPEEDRARQWLQTVNEDLIRLGAKGAEARWNYETNITEETSKTFLDVNQVYDAYDRSLQTSLTRFHPGAIEDPLVRRQIELMQQYAYNVTMWNEKASMRLRSLVTSMTTLFNTKSICSWQPGRQFCDQKWQFDPDILQLTANQRDYESLVYLWRAWRDAVGPPIRSQFLETIKLLNLKAKAMNFQDWGAVWRSYYETPNFAEEAARLFYEVLPLYEQLHAYVRRKLMQDVYRGQFAGPTIPAHILGNVMAEEWSNIYRFTMPFPNKNNFDVTRTMQSRNYNQTKLFQLADDFYTSMGMLQTPQSFWQQSIFSRIPNRRMVCHATSWDMFKNRDVRVRMCAKVSQYDLLIAHHEMGHIQYFLQYSDQPIIFRQPPNPGFHESIGDTIALAASTKNHLRTLGLLTETEDDPETDLNWLYKQALFKIPFLMFSYLVDLWRWRVFDGTYTQHNLNSGWWDLYFQLMGLSQPIARNESDFDAAAKSHVVIGMEFARYFISGILQFQFYQAMCKAAGQSGEPLHKCDFYASKLAGQRLGDMLKLGSSVHWTTAMQQLTGDSKMSADALLKYFQPLYDWLKAENAKNAKNAKNSHCYGWGQVWSQQIMSTLEQPRC